VSFFAVEEEQSTGLQKIREATAITEVTVTASPGTPRKSVTLKVDDGEAEPPCGTKYLQIPSKPIAVSSSSETLTGLEYFKKIIIYF